MRSSLPKSPSASCLVLQLSSAWDQLQRLKQHLGPELYHEWCFCAFHRKKEHSRFSEVTGSELGAFVILLIGEDFYFTNLSRQIEARLILGHFCGRLNSSAEITFIILPCIYLLAALYPPHLNFSSFSYLRESCALCPLSSSVKGSMVTFVAWSDFEQALY